MRNCWTLSAWSWSSALWFALKYSDCNCPSHCERAHTPTHTHTLMQAAGSGVIVSPLSAVCIRVCYCDEFKCVLVKPAVTSLQDTAGHNSCWHPGAIFTEHFIPPPGVLLMAPKSSEQRVFPLKSHSESCWEQLWLRNGGCWKSVFCVRILLLPQMLHGDLTFCSLSLKLEICAGFWSMDPVDAGLIQVLVRLTGWGRIQMYCCCLLVLSE